MSETRVTPPGWYDDGSGHQRWWDGNQWGLFAPQPVVTVQPVPEPLPKLSGAAVAGLIVGIVSLLGLLIPTGLSLVAPFGAILLAGVGLWETNKRGKRGNKIAAAGMVMGAVAVFLIFFVLMIYYNVH